MGKSTVEQLVAFQQTELDAVRLYQKLASLTKNEEDRKKLLSMAADEGRHAGILKGITGAQLQPSDTLANITAKFYKIGGKRFLFPFMSKFEIDSFFTYEKFFTEYPQISKIASDEIRHGHMLIGMLK